MNKLTNPAGYENPARDLIYWLSNDTDQTLVHGNKEVQKVANVKQLSWDHRPPHSHNLLVSLLDSLRERKPVNLTIRASDILERKYYLSCWAAFRRPAFFGCHPGAAWHSTPHTHATDRGTGTIRVKPQQGCRTCTAVLRPPESLDSDSSRSAASATLEPPATHLHVEAPPHLLTTTLPQLMTNRSVLKAARTLPAPGFHMTCMPDWLPTAPTII